MSFVVFAIISMGKRVGCLLSHVAVSVLCLASNPHDAGGWSIKKLI